MLTKTLSSLSLCLLLPAMGCFAQSGDPAQGQPGGDLAELLSEPVTLGIVSTEDGSFARVRAVALRSGDEYEVEVAVMGGSLTLSLDDAQLRVESLEVTAADLTVGAGVMPPEGATLTGISVALTAPVESELAIEADDSAQTAGGLPVALRWAVELDHGVVDLAPIRLPDLGFELALGLASDGEIEAHLTASQPDSFWNWAGIFELSDLELDLVASSGLSVPGSVE